MSADFTKCADDPTHSPCMPAITYGVCPGSGDKDTEVVCVYSDGCPVGGYLTSEGMCQRLAGSAAPVQHHGFWQSFAVGFIIACGVVLVLAVRRTRGRLWG